MSNKEVVKESSHVNLKGKAYEMVASRVQRFRQDKDWKNHGIETRVIENDRKNGFVVVQATIRNKEGRILGQGLAEENRSRGPVNKTSALENCETSAIGRALASIGFAGSEYASANEVENAIHQQENPTVSDELFTQILKYLKGPHRKQILKDLKAKDNEGVKKSDPDDVREVLDMMRSIEGD